MDSGLITMRGGITLPPGFIILNTDELCEAYFDKEIVCLSIERGKLQARFSENFADVVVTFGNKRRPVQEPSEELLAGRVGGAAARVDGVIHSLGNVLELVVNCLTRYNPPQDGHDAFIFTSIGYALSQSAKLSEDVVQPRALPGPGSFWRLLGVIEKS